MKKWIYNFGKNFSEGNSSMKDILGGKGANLAEMCNLGLPVPPGFTISTELCQEYYQNDKTLPQLLYEQVKEALGGIEQQIDRKFGSTIKPLLVSVRSGAKFSMPGMMDTILNLGLNDQTVEALAKISNNPRFAYDSYRRFIQMYSEIVLNIDAYHFEEALYNKKLAKKVVIDSELEASDLQEIIKNYKKIVFQEAGLEFPQDVNEQLWGAIKSVLESWMNPRAITYRKLNNICASVGTAVNIQAMVFGNLGEDSATGVTFTRNPSTGIKEIYGEYLPNAQGEDVVAGIRTPRPLTLHNKNSIKSSDISLEELMPELYKELYSLMIKLENHYRDMQDIEFTIEQGKLWLLQTRSGKRTPQASIKIAVDLVEEKIISKEEAILRINPNIIDQLLHPALDDNQKYKTVAKGLPASPGAVSGKVYFSAEEVEKQSAFHSVILVRNETSPEDIAGMHAASGILTVRGGMTSHAAVVARGMGKCCIVGASEININYADKYFTSNEIQIKEGETITLNGSSGEIILGEVKTIDAQLSKEFNLLIEWANQNRSLRVRANADTIKDAEVALKFGAEGIGLCRTEHMFFDPERIVLVREMILAKDLEHRKNALAKILPMQIKDFTGILTVMQGLPVTIRLLDPPLHEFLPHSLPEIEQMASYMNISIEQINNRLSKLKEHNPMLGHRGCRLGITYPEIYEMQVRAIFEAAVKTNFINIEIMVPLIMGVKEFEIIKKIIDDLALEIMEQHKVKLSYLVGTMIELPRAALCADEIAKSAQFFSFGTNDLTQTTLGISRDDSASYITEYLHKNIVKNDPFLVLDQEGVGQLVKMAVEKGRSANKSLKIGICGEHGGDPESVEFFHKIGLEYVSCSPYRVPVAIIAAAQSKIRNN